MQLVFKKQALEDLIYFVRQNPNLARKILELCEDTLRNPFSGLGKPEPLKADYQGCWSRRIDREHRLVYRVYQGNFEILACRFHYDH